MVIKTQRFFKNMNWIDTYYGRITRNFSINTLLDKTYYTYGLDHDEIGHTFIKLFSKIHSKLRVLYSEWKIERFDQLPIIIPIELVFYNTTQTVISKLLNGSMCSMCIRSCLRDQFYRPLSVKPWLPGAKALQHHTNSFITSEDVRNIHAHRERERELLFKTNMMTIKIAIAFSIWPQGSMEIMTADPSRLCLEHWLVEGYQEEKQNVRKHQVMSQIYLSGFPTSLPFPPQIHDLNTTLFLSTFLTT